MFLDYNVESKDGSPITEEELYITGAVIFLADGYFSSADKISTEINDNKCILLMLKLL